MLQILPAAAKDLACAEFLPASVSKEYEMHDNASYFAANLRYLMEGAATGLSLSHAAAGQMPDPVIAAGIGFYLAIDLIYQTGCEFKNYRRRYPRFGACEQPATLAIEAGYFVGKQLLLGKHERKKHV